MRISIIATLLLATSTGHAEPLQPAADDVDPRTAQLISLGATAVGLGGSAYFWIHASLLEEGNGRFENQAYAATLATLTVGAGPMTGLLVGGEHRRALVGGLTRPLMIATGAGGIVVGAMIVGWGCFETDDCAGAKIGGYGVIGAGAALGLGALGWAAYDLWSTPDILRSRRKARDRVGTRLQLAPMIARDRVGLAASFVL